MKDVPTLDGGQDIWLCWCWRLLLEWCERKTLVAGGCCWSYVREKYCWPVLEQNRVEDSTVA